MIALTFYHAGILILAGLGTLALLALILASFTRCPVCQRYGCACRCNRRNRTIGKWVE